MCRSRARTLSRRHFAKTDFALLVSLFSLPNAMTTSPSLLGERLSHMIFHSPLNELLDELQAYDDLLKPLLHTSDFSLRLLLSIPLLAHDRDPIFRLATFCLLLEAGCDPDARGADSRCILWELDGLNGELREWIEEEWIKAKSSKEVEGGYSMREFDRFERLRRLSD